MGATTQVEQPTSLADTQKKSSPISARTVTRKLNYANYCGQPSGTSGVEPLLQLLSPTEVVDVLLPPLCSHYSYVSLRASRCLESLLVLFSVSPKLLSHCFSSASQDFCVCFSLSCSSYCLSASLSFFFQKKKNPSCTSLLRAVGGMMARRVRMSFLAVPSSCRRCC